MSLVGLLAAAPSAHAQSASDGPLFWASAYGGAAGYSDEDVAAGGFYGGELGILLGGWMMARLERALLNDPDGTGEQGLTSFGVGTRVPLIFEKAWNLTLALQGAYYIHIPDDPQGDYDLSAYDVGVHLAKGVYRRAFVEVTFQDWITSDSEGNWFTTEIGGLRARVGIQFGI